VARRSYGTRRVLRDALEYRFCGLHLIERLMRAQGTSKAPKEFQRQWGALGSRGDILDRDFEEDHSNSKWLADSKRYERPILLRPWVI
jgi:hypothetical protein